MSCLYMLKREMTVSYATGEPSRSEGQTPMIRIANRFLLGSGFMVGSKIEIEYGNEVIKISKITNQTS